MSFHEGSKWQEQQEDAAKGLSKKAMLPAKQEKEHEDALIEKGLLNVFEKANKLEFQDFKGWMKGEGYSMSKKQI